MQITKLELIRRISADLGDLRELKATEASTVKTRLTDQLNIWPGCDVMVGSFLIFTSEDDVGHIARVVNVDRGSGVVIYAPETSVVVASGDAVYAVNIGNQGWHPSDYERTVSTVVAETIPLAPFTGGQTMVFDGQSPVIDLSVFDGTESVLDVWYIEDDESGAKYSVPPASERGADGYWVDPFSVTITVYGPWVEILDGRTIGIVFSVPNEGFVDWVTPITIDPEYLVVESCWRLLENGIRKDPSRYTLMQNLTPRRERIGNLIRTRTTQQNHAVRYI